VRETLKLNSMHTLTEAARTLADALLVILGLRRKRRALAHLEQAEEHLLKRKKLKSV